MDKTFRLNSRILAEFFSTGPLRTDNFPSLQRVELLTSEIWLLLRILSQLLELNTEAFASGA